MRAMLFALLLAIPVAAAEFSDSPAYSVPQEVLDKAKRQAEIRRAQDETIRNFGAVFVGVSLLVLYFVPVIVARTRRHPNTEAIGALNFLLGWTFIGWVIALVWALTATASQEKRMRASTTSSPRAPISESPRGPISKREQYLQQILVGVLIAALVLAVAYVTSIER